MTLTNTWPINSGTAGAVDIRNVLTGVWRNAGVVPFSCSQQAGASFPTLLVANSSMTPTVRDFTAVYQRSTSDGFSGVRNIDSAGSVPAFGTAPASGSRMDRFVLNFPDTSKGDSGATPSFKIRAGTATTGDPNSTVGALQAGDLPLYKVTIPAGATGLTTSGVVFTPEYVSASQIGSVRWVRNATERLALPTLPAAGFPIGAGELVGQDDIDSLYRYDGTDFRPLDNDKPYGLIRRSGSSAVPGTGSLFAPDSTFTWDSSSLILRGGMQIDAKAQAWTVPMSGDYMLDASMQWATNSSGPRSIWWIKNPNDPNAANATEIGSKTVASAQVQAVNGDSTVIKATAVVSLAKGDRVVVWARQTSGGDLAVVPGSNEQSRAATFTSVRYMGPSN